MVMIDKTVVVRNGNGFDFAPMRDCEMCALLEQLIVEINRRKKLTSASTIMLAANDLNNKENLCNFELPDNAENVRYEINNFEINVPELNDTQNIMRCYMISNGMVYSDKKSDFLTNLTELLQCGFGVQIGFMNDDITDVEVCNEKK